MLKMIYNCSEYSCLDEDGACPYKEIHGYPRYYEVVLTGDEMECAYGTYWSQEDCACVNGKLHMSSHTFKVEVCSTIL